MIQFSQINDLATLAFLLNIPLKKLTYILYVKHPDSYYSTFEIPKANGETRTIHAPSSDLKTIQSTLASILSSHVQEYNKTHSIKADISHAFEKNKSIMTNASVHRHKRFILNVDLKDYFDHFHFGRVRGFFHKSNYFKFPIKIATVLAQLTCYNGKLPQGAPTSPVITNMISNILDMRLLPIVKKYGLDYTRYADDMTFSTNRKDFKRKHLAFLKELRTEINNFGFEINDKKTRIIYNDSHQEVTGLVVNQKVNVCRTFYKNTRAMANSLYTTGEFQINGCSGTMNQLDGRFSFIQQIEKYNALDETNNKSFYNLSSRGREYQRFLFFKYFYANERPLIVTEGDTDINYIKSALKNLYAEYPRLITKNRDSTFTFHVSFLKRSPRLKDYLGIFPDGADTMQNIYHAYTGKDKFPNYEEYFKKTTGHLPSQPVILLFDNEQIHDKPLKKFLKHIHQKKLNASEAKNIHTNLYVATIPLLDNVEECEMEDLFEQPTLSHLIGGKTFCRKDDYDTSKFYGKRIFSNYIANNYLSINFDQFRPLLDLIDQTIVNYHNLEKTIEESK